MVDLVPDIEVAIFRAADHVVFILANHRAHLDLGVSVSFVFVFLTEVLVRSHLLTSRLSNLNLLSAVVTSTSDGFKKWIPVTFRPSE